MKDSLERYCMPYRMWINSAYITGSSANVIEVHNPAAEEFIDITPAANAADVNLPFTAAQATFTGWKKNTIRMSVAKKEVRI